MKKIMIALAAVAVATISQAASIDWSVANNSWTLNNGSKAAAGTAVYLIDGNTALDTIAAAINTSTGAFDADQSWVFASGATGNAKGAVSSTTATTDKLTRGTSYDFSVLMIDATDTSDIRFMVSATSPQTAYLSGTDEQASVAFGAATLGANALTASASAANGWAQVVPEPTSGLLLLIGMAGLALRRGRRS